MTWYNTGTVKTTANSAIVVGTNTAWITSGLRPGDMLLIGYNTVSPRPFEIKSIDSATQITLVIAFPVAVTAAAYVGIPMLSGDRTAITMTLAQQVTKAFADNQAMQAVWQSFYSGSGTITLTMPDGSKVTGSSFLKLTADMAGKANKTDLGTAASKNVGAVSGTVADGNDWRFNTIDGKSGGLITGSLINEANNMYLRASDVNGGWPYLINFMAGQGNNVTYARIYHERGGDFTIATAANATAKYFQFTAAGDLTVNRNIQCTTLVQTSDRDKKDKILTIPNALEKINAIRGCTYNLKESGTPSAGVIAQELMGVLPEAVGSVFDEADQYGEVEEEVQTEVENEDGEKTLITETIKATKLLKKRDETKRSYTVEYSGVVALAVQAINELSEKVKALEVQMGLAKENPGS